MLKRAKVNLDYTPNDLRHTYITDMLRNGIKSAPLASQVGNSTEIIENIYNHLNPNDTKEIASIAAKIQIGLTRDRISDSTPPISLNAVRIV